MGGHGGLNILPQKSWNVYNYENREKVRRDEEAAAREEQLKREQARKRDAEFRLDRLRQVRGIHHQPPTEEFDGAAAPASDSKHINLFEGLKFFSTLGGEEEASARRNAPKRQKREEKDDASTRAVGPEDEKYRMGYGVAGKGVKTPWYLSRPSDVAETAGRDASDTGRGGSGKKSGGKKTLEELREERLQRENREKERERALLLGKRGGDGAARSSRFSSQLWVSNHGQLSFLYHLSAKCDLKDTINVKDIQPLISDNNAEIHEKKVLASTESSKDEGVDGVTVGFSGFQTWLYFVVGFCSLNRRREVNLFSTEASFVREERWQADSHVDGFHILIRQASNQFLVIIHTKDSVTESLVVKGLPQI
ncbi:hypothetical protein ACLOJK_003144 [Asimina triloba]